jgi:predicted thioesterase
VLPEWTIAYYDPRLPPVLSTPAMIALMEIAAAWAVAPHLPPGTITVGTRIVVDHLEPARPGDRLRIRARLSRHEGQFLVFSVEARAGRRLLGQGEVFRAIVDTQRFARERRPVIRRNRRAT